MFFSFVVSLLVFGGVVLGLAWPLATRLNLDCAEKLTASIGLSLLGVFLLGWTIYVCALSLLWFWILPAAATLGLITGWSSLRTTLSDADTAGLAWAQIIITLWSVAWLALILSYSGGDWVADWFGHLQRTWFFIDRGPRDILFNGFDALTSRPPLANIMNGAFLELTKRNFAHYQFFSTLFGSMTFLPAGLLARRWGGTRAIAVLAVLFMANPMYVENVTYAWTKLPAAFFTLAALYFFLRAHDKSAHLINGMLFAAMLAAGLITHYSTGPYALLLGSAWMVLGWPRRREIAWWQSTLFSVIVGTLILATWFGWALANYGLKGTLMTNTSITDQAPSVVAQLQIVMLNLRDTLVPHFLRTVDFNTFAQRSSSGWWRDWFFTLYQTNFFFAFGTVIWAAILVMLVWSWHSASVPRRIFWAFFIIGAITTGIAVHGSRSTWGLAHICLQPLVFLGLAFIAAHWPRISYFWRLVLIVGAIIDFPLGILLQLGSEAFAFERWFPTQQSIFQAVGTYSFAAQANFQAKIENHWVFFGDVFITYGAVTGSLLATLLLVALIRASSGKQSTRT